MAAHGSGASFLLEPASVSILCYDNRDRRAMLLWNDTSHLGRNGRESQESTYDASLNSCEVFNTALRVLHRALHTEVVQLAVDMG